MRLVFLLACMWYAYAEDVHECVVFNDHNYDKTILKTFPTSVAPRGFSFVKSKNTLFFSYSLPEERTDDEQYTAVVSLNVATNEMREIPGIISGSNTAIDPDTEDIYLAGLNGIFKYNPDKETAGVYTAKDVNVNFIYYDKFLFYVNHGNKKLYKFDGNVTEEISKDAGNGGTVNKFIRNGNEYFSLSNSKLYRVVVEPNKSNIEEELFTAPTNDFIYLGFAKDNNNNLFVYGEDAVYVPNREQKKLDKVADIKNVEGLAFDKDNNVIYSNNNEIFKLTRSECTPASV